MPAFLKDKGNETSSIMARFHFFSRGEVNKGKTKKVNEGQKVFALKQKKTGKPFTD